jgi:hypothetical protein
VYIPKGTPHTFANISGRPARALLICTPAGFETHFDRVLAAHEGRELPAASAAEIETFAVGPRIAGASRLHRLVSLKSPGTSRPWASTPARSPKPS